MKEWLDFSRTIKTLSLHWLMSFYSIFTSIVGKKLKISPVMLTWCRSNGHSWCPEKRAALSALYLHGPELSLKAEKQAVPAGTRKSRKTRVLNWILLRPGCWGQRSDAGKPSSHCSLLIIVTKTAVFIWRCTSKSKLKHLFGRSSCRFIRKKVRKRNRRPQIGCPLSQKTPGRLVLVAFQFGVDDSAGGAADGQLLSGLHLITDVSQTPLRIHLKLLLQGGGTRGGGGGGGGLFWV